MLTIDSSQLAQLDAQVLRVEDLCGLRCPMPILKTKKALAQMQAGEVLKVLTTDAAAVEDLALFCKQTGHELLAQMPQEAAAQSAVPVVVPVVAHWIARKPAV